MMLAAAAALTFADPAGDARGDGAYVLPTRPAISADALDLRSLTVTPLERGTRLTIGFGGQQNPWNLDSGFSAGVTDIFVRTTVSGVRTLTGLGLQTAEASGWRYHLRVSGAGGTLERADGPDGETRVTLGAPQVRMDGPNLIVDAAELPSGTYGYWVTSSVYSPLTRDGLLRPSAGAGALGLRASGSRAPVPVDVLAAPGDRRAYEQGVLAAVGQERDWRLSVLLGLSGLGLALAALATWRGRQEAHPARPPTESAPPRPPERDQATPDQAESGQGVPRIGRP